MRLPAGTSGFGRVFLRRGLPGAHHRSMQHASGTTRSPPSSPPSAAPGAVGQGAGYQGFGSFHSDNIEALLALPDAEFEQRLPAVPDALLCAARHPFHGRTEAPAFGSEAMVAQFCLDPTWTFLNHGAFGAATRQAMRVADLWRHHQEEQPLRFFDRTLLPWIARAQREFAPVIGARPQDVVFVPNATTALNAVVASVVGALAPGDEVLVLDLAYGSVKTMLREACVLSGARYCELALSPAASADEAAAAIEAGLTERTRLAVLDHVTSNTAMVLPIARLSTACRDRGVRVLVDGAHGLLSQPLDMAALGADWYIGNCHKWLATPKGCGFLWARDEEAQAMVRPRIVSHGWGHGFVSSFMWDGARDYAPVLTVPIMLAFWRGLGGLDAARGYGHALAQQAGQALAEAWGTSKPLTHPSAAGNMLLVQLPKQLQGDGTSMRAKTLQDWLHAQRVEVPVKSVGGKLYVRISAHVYNTAAQYTRLQELILACRA